MPELWTCEVFYKMHQHDINQKQLAKELGVSRTYLNQILKSKKRSATMEARCNEAIESIIKKRVKN